MSYSMSLDMQQKMGQKQTQRLIMSRQMQQAIHLLQMPIMELEAAIEVEMEQNPVLEYSQEDCGPEATKFDEAEACEADANDNTDLEKEVTIDTNDFDVIRRLDEEYGDHFALSGTYTKRTVEDDKMQTFLESSVRSCEGRFAQLVQESREHFDDPADLAIAEIILGDLDDNGFFTMSMEEVSELHGFPLDRVRDVLHDIQTFDPPGIAAKDLQESLLIQLRRQGKSNKLSYSIVEKHYDDLLHNRIPAIQKSLRATAQQIREAIEQDIIPLDLHPGKGMIAMVTQPATADVTVVEEDGVLKATVNDERLPSLRINRKYLRMLDDENLPSQTKEYIKQKVFNGKWLLRNLCQRGDTLLRIAESLTKWQKVFFMNPEGPLVPLTMKTIAEELELHESTIARAVNSKYIDCPRGLLPLRSFFTNALTTEEGQDISSSVVKDALLDIVKNEDKRKPYSDDALSRKLKEKGFTCARRTVAKYRIELKIGNTSQRREY